MPAAEEEEEAEVVAVVEAAAVVVAVAAASASGRDLEIPVADRAGVTSLVVDDVEAPRAVRVRPVESPERDVSVGKGAGGGNGSPGS